MQILRSEFCPPIDEPVFLAICSDYDLQNKEGLSACLRDLEIIKAAAIETDTSAFDASGTGGFAVKDSGTSGESESSLNGATSGSQDVESITTGLSDLAWDDPSAEGQCLDDAGEDGKTAWLKAMFPDVTKENICYRLQKCNKNLTRTIDELLNLSFINHNEPGGQSAIPKGIEGFTQAEDHGRGRKGKGKRRMHTNDTTTSDSATSMNTTISREAKNVWTSMADDVEFICARTVFNAQSVRSMYNAQNKLLGATIGSMASEEGVKLKSIQALDSLNQIHLAELRRDFPTVPDSQLYGLLVISGNMVSTAQELATVMLASPTQTSAGKIEIIRRYAPIDLSSDVVSRNSRASSSWNQDSHSGAKNLAMAKATAGSTAFSQASHAYKRGKSDHLMGGAAAYYAAIGNENVRAAKELSAQAAESHVMSQSTSNMLDLHGVSVADAVRIAREEVASWWHSLGDTKYANGGGGLAREGYRVVTGMGRHSRDGAPKIGPAVSRMLVREGWKVTVGQGEILITGKARRS